jgi:hypothetical protein
VSRAVTRCHVLSRALGYGRVRWRRVIHAHGPRREGAWGVCGVDFEPRNLQQCVRNDTWTAPGLILSVVLQLRRRRVIHAHGPRREGAWGVCGVDLSVVLQLR